MSHADARSRSGDCENGADDPQELGRRLDEYVARLWEENRIAEEEFDRTMLELEANRCWLDRLLDRIGFAESCDVLTQSDDPDFPRNPS